MGIVIGVLTLYVSYILLIKIYPTNYLKWLEKNVTINTSDLNEILSLYFSGNYITQENLAGLEIDEKFKQYISDYYQKKYSAPTGNEKQQVSKYIILMNASNRILFPIFIIMLFIIDIVILAKFLLEIGIGDEMLNSNHPPLLFYPILLVFIILYLYKLYLLQNRLALLIINKKGIRYKGKKYSFGEISTEGLKAYLDEKYKEEINIDFEIVLKNNERLQVDCKYSQFTMYDIANTLLYYINSWKEKQAQNSNN